MSDSICVSCGSEVRPRQEALQCDACNLWQHRTCNTQTSIEDLLKAWKCFSLNEVFTGGGPSKEQQEEQREKQEEMKNTLLSQVLDQSARARLNTISLAKPEKAKSIENMVIQMARMGQIQEKLNEDQLKSILEQINERTQKKTTVTFNRRRMDDSDED